MIHSLLVEIALVVIIIRCALKAFHMLSGNTKDWLELLFQISIVIVALEMLI